MKDLETEIRKRLADIQALCRGKLSPRDYDAVVNAASKAVLAAKAADRAAIRSAAQADYTQAEVAGAEDKKTHDAAAILSLLQRGEAITPVRAVDMGILRLSARIWDLRAKGFPIETKLVKVGRSRVAEYRLKTI